MEDVIKKIIKIEEKAQAIMDGAISEKMRMEQDFDEKLTSLDNRIIGEAKRKVKELRERELSENSELVNAQVTQCDEKLQVMEKAVAENRDKWIDTLVANVLGK